MSDRTCPEYNGKTQCMRPAGHADVHMWFGPNCARTWGWLS